MPITKTEERLGRNLTFFPVFAIGTGTMIGAGIFVLPGIATASAGPAAAISFLLGGIISMATALSMAELATGMPRAGGSYYFISRAMGPLFGSIIGLGAWLALIFKGSFALVGLAEYLNALVPIPVLATAFVAGVLLIALNYRGAKNSGQLQNGIVIGLFLILIVFILRGSSMVEADYFQPFLPYGVNSIFITTGIIFVSYLGITQLAAISEEVKEPSKNLPRVFIASVAAVTLLYVGVMLIINGILPLEKLIATTTPLVDVGKLMAGTLGSLAIISAGFFATVSTANAAILSSSRFPFAMGRDNLMPRWFIEIHDSFRTPHRSIAITGVVMLILIFVFDVEALARLGSAFNVLIFALINASVVVLRKTRNEWYQPSFNDPLYPASQIIGAAGSLILLPQLGTVPLLFAAALILVGTIWYAVYAAGRAQPEYNLLDMLENEEVPVHVGDRRKRVLVSVANPEHEMDLLQLAGHLGNHISVLNVIRVPLQTDLRGALEDYDERMKNRRNRLEEGVRSASSHNPDRDYRFLVVFDHSIPDAISTFAESEDAELIVMGWQEKDRLHERLGDVSNEILKSSHRHVAVLKGHLPAKLEKILVPYGGGNNSRYALYLAKRLALATGADIRLLRVVSPDLEAKAREAVEIEAREVAACEEGCTVHVDIRERYSLTDTILECNRETDLTIIGDSNERIKRTLLGRVPLRVTRHADNPVLLVKRFRRFSTEGLRRHLKRLSSTKSEGSGSEAAETHRLRIGSSK